MLGNRVTYTTGAAQGNTLDALDLLETNVLKGLAALALGARLDAVLANLAGLDVLRLAVHLKLNCKISAGQQAARVSEECQYMLLTPLPKRLQRYVRP